MDSDKNVRSIIAGYLLAHTRSNSCRSDDASGAVAPRGFVRAAQPRMAGLPIRGNRPHLSLAKMIRTRGKTLSGWVSQAADESFCSYARIIKRGYRRR